MMSVVLAGLPAQHAGVASGVLATVQQVGNALGVALIGILFHGRLGNAADALAYASAFGISLIYLLALALLVAMLFQRLPKQAMQA